MPSSIDEIDSIMALAEPAAWRAVANQLPLLFSEKTSNASVKPTIFQGLQCMLLPEK